MAPRPLTRARALVQGLRVLPADQLASWVKSQGSSDHLRSQDYAIASFLERAGIPTRRDRHGDLHALGLVSGEVRQEAGWRHINVIPSVAAAGRRGLLLSVEYFHKHHGGPFALRYAVITSGGRVPVGGDLRGAFEGLHRRTSQWASLSRRRFGVEVLLRASESTTKADGSQHPHVNVLWRPTRVLDRADWSRFLTWSRSFLGAHWKECGKVDDLREIVKYITKPEDMLLADQPDALVPWIYRETLRLHMVQPMGALADMMREHRERGVSVRRLTGRDHVPVLTLVESQRCPRDEDDDQVVDPVQPVKRENLILGLPSLPCPAFLPLAEPVLRVLGYTETPQTPEGRAGLARIRSMKAHWAATFAKLVTDPSQASEAARAALIVHNTTVTVTGGGGGFPSGGVASPSRHGPPVLSQGPVFRSDEEKAHRPSRSWS